MFRGRNRRRFILKGEKMSDIKEMFKEIAEEKREKMLKILMESNKTVDNLNRISRLLYEGYIASSIFNLKDMMKWEGIGPVCEGTLTEIENELKSRDVHILKKINTSEESDFFKIDVFKLMDETTQLLIDLKEKADELKAVLSWFNAILEECYNPTDEL